MTSAQRKLHRAIDQIETLQDEAEVVKDEDAYVFTVERERRSLTEVVYRMLLDGEKSSI